MHTHTLQDIHYVQPAADLDGVELALPPPFGRQTDTVTVLLLSENGTALWWVLNFDHSTVKHALQNTQNDCHQRLSYSSRVHQIRFWPGFYHGPRWGSLERSPRPPSWFKRPTCKGKWSGEGKGIEREGKEGGGRAPLRKFLDGPLTTYQTTRASITLQ